MRTIDLSLYADRLAGEAASLAARIEREHGRLRQGAIERAARGALPPVAVERLEALGLLGTRVDPLALAELEETLDALEALEAWVEEALVRSADVAAGTTRAEAGSARETGSRGSNRAGSAGGLRLGRAANGGERNE
jgi:hypothetical protein